MKRTFTTPSIFTTRMLVLASMLLAAASTTSLHAQLTGTKNIPGDYADLAAAITDLNAVGVGVGGVTLNLVAGNPQTGPVGGYSITTLTGTAANPIVLQGNSNTITANGGLTAGALNDAIFKIIGADWVTITGFTMQENAANLTTAAATNNMTEWGVAILYTTTTDGSQNCTIQNNTISLNRVYQNTFGVYSNSTHAPATIATSATATGANGGNHNLVIRANTISNVNIGVVVVGPTAAADQNLNITVGGNAAVDGNTISDYGTTGTFSGYANVSGTVYGVLVRNSVNYNISNNSITSSNGGTSAGTLRGIYVPSFSNAPTGTLTNKIDNNTLSVTSAVATGTLQGISVESSTSTATSSQSISNNNFTALTYSVAASGTVTIISATVVVLTANINNNTFTNLSVNTTGSTTFIAHGYSMQAGATQTFNNNSIVTAFTKLGAGGTVTGLSAGTSSASGSFSNMTNNNFSNITVSGATAITGISNTDGSGSSPSRTVTGNTFNNWTGGTSAIIGMTFSYIGSPSSTVSNNTLTNFSNQAAITGIIINNTFAGANPLTISNNTINTFTSTGTGGAILGISCSNTSTTVNINNNTINTLSTTGASATSGIVVSGATATSVFKNKIYDLSGSNATSTVNGILVSGGTLVNVYNNLIGDLRTPAANAANPLIGLNITGGTTVNAYYNTVNLNGTSTGALFGSSAVSVSTTPTVTLRNNIFVNTSTPVGAAGFTSAYRRSTTALATYGATSNNNLFYAGVPGVNNLIFYDGTNSSQTIAAYKTFVTPRDAGSITENPPFLSTAGASANFLHINTAIATQVESGAVNVAGITDDYDAQTRQGNPGYAGAGTAPDIGADEGDFIILDLAGPNITYTPLLGFCGTGDGVLAGVTITDGTGVPTTGALRPRIYYKKGAGAYSSQPGTLTSGTATNGIWSFNIIAADMGGLAVGDVISYYVIAQDIVIPINISSNPSGVVATDVNTVTTHPATPNTSTVLGSLSGTYTVGAGGNYATLTAAVADYNTKCLNGPVVFSLTDAVYGAETYPITINQVTGASAVNTLTIKPAVGISPSFTGSAATALIVLNGADFIIINGSNGNGVNTVCPLSTATRDLTITNTNTGTSSAVIWLQTTGTNGATNNQVINCNLVGNGNTQTLFGVGAGSNVISISSLGTGNNNNTFVNNNISKVQYALYSQGASTANKNTGNVISQNLVNTAAPNNVRRAGVYVGFENNITIAGNNISGIESATSIEDVFGITFGTNAISTSTFTGNEVTNAVVSNNIIGSIRHTNTYSACGIFVAPATSGTNQISNNTISGVSANGTSGDFTAGILLGGGAGSSTLVYYNTITMTGSQSGGTDKSYGLAIGGSNPTVDVRNNIFVNTQNNGTGNNYAIGYGYSTFTNLTSNNNDFFVTNPGATFFIGATASISAPTNQLTLANLQTATGKDGLSLNVNPVFTSATDLHLGAADPANATLLCGGTPIAAVTTDIDCATRSNLTPTIGADNVPLNFTADITVTGSKTICNGTTVTLTASPASGVTYAWSTLVTTASIMVTPAATTTYTVTVTNGSCSTSTSVTITVNPLPTVGISTTPVSGTVACGTSATLLASGGGTYLWTGGATDASLTITPIITTTYTVIVTSAESCSATQSATITVTPLPAPSIAVTPGNTVCAPNQITLDAGAEYNTYSWTGGGASQSITVAASGTYTVTVSNAAGCMSTNSVTVTVNPAPGLTETHVDPTDCFTSDGSIDLVVAPAGTYTYNWATTNGAGLVNGIQDQSNLSVGTYNVTVTTSGTGCTSTLSITLSVQGGCGGCAPVTSVTVDPSPICAGNTSTFTAIGTLPGATFTWFDMPTGGSQVGTGVSFTSVPLNTTTTYCVEQTVGLPPQSDVFEYTGGVQTFTVPAGVTSISIQALGANGDAGAGAGPGGVGALGGQATGTLAVVPGQVLNIYVGGAGNGQTGGFNGGANGGAGVGFDAGAGGIGKGGGGGGASDIRVNGVALTDRVIVAGGGGGGGANGCTQIGGLNVPGGAGGAGGGGNGLQGTNSASGGGGFGGTVGLGGAKGVGCAGFSGMDGSNSGTGGDGQGCCCQAIPAGGGGGGGFVTGGGGGGGSAGTTGCQFNDKGAGGGGAGGSSFTGGVSGGATVNGVRSGNGQIILTYSSLCTSDRTCGTATVNPTPNAVATPASQTVCSGVAITTIVLSGNVPNTTYNWTRNNTGTVTGIAANGAGNISGTLTNTTAAPITVTFTITPTANGCPGTAITATVLVNPTPNAVATPASQTICSAAAITTIVLSGNVAGTTYNWTRDNVATVTGIAANGAGNISGSLTNTTAAPITVTFTITPTANGCPGTAITATVLVNPTPNAVATPASQTACSGVAITTIVLSSNVAGATYTWTRDNNAAVTGIAANGAGNISGTLTNTTAAPITVTFTITPSANGCPGAAITATVLVNPTPNAVANPAAQTICSGATITTIALSGNVANTTFNWTRNNTALVTGIAAAGAGNISGVLTNTTNAPITVTFTITPTANGCPGVAITATVLVNPVPSTFALTGGGEVCTTDVIGVNVGLSGSQTNVNYQLRLNGNPVGAPIAGTGAAISFGPQLAGTYTVLATHTQGGCTAVMTGSALVSNFNCLPSISDPCVCLNNATTLFNGQFGEQIKVNAPAGQVWTVTAVTGLYLQLSPLPPTNPFPIPVGTVLVNMGTMFTLDGRHIDAIGYTVSVSNGRGTTFTIGNTCEYPNPSITTVFPAEICLFSDPIPLVGNPGDANIVSQGFTVNGVATNTFDPSQGTGSYSIVYTVNGGTPKAFGPNDPGCIQSVSTFVNVVVTPTNLVCNDQLTLSLEADCTKSIFPDDVLEGAYLCYDDYIVEVDKNIPFGNGPWFPADFDASDIGKNYQVRVTHLVSGNKCWGNLKVEDKVEPTLSCESYSIPCNTPNVTPAYLQNTLGISSAIPFTFDCQAINLTYIDIEQDQNCATGLSKTIERTWTAVDLSGNSSTCLQIISLFRPSLGDVVPPPDYDDIDAPSFSCEDNLPRINGRANPTPEWIEAQGLQGYPNVFGQPSGCTINWTYTDYPIYVCDGTIKYRREWTIVDWCAGDGFLYNQILKVLDASGPNISCPANLTVSTDPFACCATINLPDVIVEDNCSRISLITGMIATFDAETGVPTGMLPIGGSLQDFPGNNWWDLDTLANFGWTSCLPIGNQLVTYIAKDDCGNTSSCTFRLIVADLVPPVASCDETTTVAIGGDDLADCYTPADGCDFAGVTWVKASVFNDGSHDNCNNLKFTIRRMAPYSDCINNLDESGCYLDDFGDLVISERDIATLELDSIKFYCCEVGTTQTIILAAYQVDVNGNIMNGVDGEPIKNECMIQVEVQDKLKPACLPPTQRIVNCENFDPSLWAYGNAQVTDNCCLDTNKVYQGQCGLSHSVNYSLFDTVCNKGTITRTFRAFDCHGLSSSCTQRVIVNYTQDYYIKFPNDAIVTTCDGTGVYGEPIFFGEDCELLGVSFEDEIFTVVPDACFKIERTWQIINWCTYNPNGSCMNVPNPNPNAITNHITNLAGPTVSACGTLPPWKATVVKINPTDPLPGTDYCAFWGDVSTNGLPNTPPDGNNEEVNCYSYKQIIKIIDGQAPTGTYVVPDCSNQNWYTANRGDLWNESYWWDNGLQLHDLCEEPTDLCITATDACSGSNVNIEYLLFLDLDGDGTMETVINSVNTGIAGYGWNNVPYNNANNPNFSGGTPSAFDERPVPGNQKWGFAIQETIAGNNKTACVRWNTQQQQNTYVVPELPHGTHKIKWFITDGCGNNKEYEYTFTVKDCKAPTVVCLNGLSVNIMPTGMIPMWASDFLQYTEDNCTPNPLKISIRKCGTGTGFPVDAFGNPILQVTFTCAELGTQCVELWAIDAAGNADYCETYVIVQDNLGNCAPGNNIVVSGALKTELSDGIEEAVVNLFSTMGDLTDNQGLYNFNNVPIASTFTIAPEKDDNPLNGVTTYDLVLISKHILGLEPLNSPYKMIAADANKSGSITTFDIVEIRKLILGIYTELPNNTSWRFVDKVFSFPSPNNPFQTVFPEWISIANAMVNQVNQDFVGVKIGDVNNTVVANATMQAEERTTGTAIFDLEDRSVKAGEEFEVTFKSAQQLKGFQFTATLNGLKAISTVDGENVTSSNFNLLPENAMAISIDGAQSFTVRFRAMKAGKLSEMLGVSGSITRAEAYLPALPAVALAKEGGVERVGIAFRFDGKTIAGVGFELYQNQPNPFVNRTFVGFFLPEAAEATLSVFDESGRVVYQQKGQFAKGENTIALDRALINTTGLLYYKLETATDSATKKMIQAK